MAITAETRQDIIELVVTAYGAAPGTTLLTELVAIINDGGTLADVADNLTSRSEWTSRYPSFQTAEEFATEWLGNLLPEADAAALAGGVDIAVGLVNSGASFGSIIMAAQDFLSNLPETDAEFGVSAANFNNKVEVATYHTVTLEQSDQSVSLIADVTSDDASVQSAIDSYSANVPSSDVVSLTLGADKETAAGFDSANVFVPGTGYVNTLDDNDSLVGLGDNATLTAELGAANDIDDDASIQPMLENITTISASFITGTGRGTTLNLRDANDDVENVSITRITQDSSATITEMGPSATNLSVSNSTNAGAITFSHQEEVLTGSETVNLALSDVRTASLDMEEGGDGAADDGYYFETVNITTSGLNDIDAMTIAANVEEDASEADLDQDINITAAGTATQLGLEINDLTADGAESITITADSRVEISADNRDADLAAGNDGITTAELEMLTISGGANVLIDGLDGADAMITVDASEMTGNLRLGIAEASDATTSGTYASGTDEDLSVTSGSGDDTIETYEALAGDITTNAGDDSVTVGGDMEGVSAIVTGDGDDSVTVENMQATASDNNEAGNETYAVQGAHISTGAGDDTITADALQSNADWDNNGTIDGDNNDTQVIRGAMIDAGDGVDTISFETVAEGASVDAGAGDDTVNVGLTTAATILEGDTDANQETVVDDDNPDVPGGRTDEVDDAGAADMLGAIVDAGADTDVISFTEVNVVEDPAGAGAADEVGTLDAYTIIGQDAEVRGAETMNVSALDAVTVVTQTTMADQDAGTLGVQNDINANVIGTETLNLINLNQIEDDDNLDDLELHTAVADLAANDDDNNNVAITADIMRFDESLATINLVSQERWLQTGPATEVYEAGTSTTFTLQNLRDQTITLSAFEATGVDGAGALEDDTLFAIDTTTGAVTNDAANTDVFLVLDWESSRGLADAKALTIDAEEAFDLDITLGASTTDLADVDGDGASGNAASTADDDDMQIEQFTLTFTDALSHSVDLNGFGDDGRTELDGDWLAGDGNNSLDTVLTVNSNAAAGESIDVEDVTANTITFGNAAGEDGASTGEIAADVTLRVTAGNVYNITTGSGDDIIDMRADDVRADDAVDTNGAYDRADYISASTGRDTLIVDGSDALGVNDLAAGTAATDVDDDVFETLTGIESIIVDATGVGAADITLDEAASDVTGVDEIKIVGDGDQTSNIVIGNNFSVGTTADNQNNAFGDTTTAGLVIDATDNDGQTDLLIESKDDDDDVDLVNLDVSGWAEGALNIEFVNTGDTDARTEVTILTSSEVDAFSLDSNEGGDADGEVDLIVTAGSLDKITITDGSTANDGGVGDAEDVLAANTLIIEDDWTGTAIEIDASGIADTDQDLDANGTITDAEAAAALLTGGLTVSVEDGDTANITFHGTQNNDDIVLGSGADTINGNAGDDTIEGDMITNVNDVLTLEDDTFAAGDSFSVTVGGYDIVVEVGAANATYDLNGGAGAQLVAIAGNIGTSTDDVLSAMQTAIIAAIDDGGDTDWSTEVDSATRTLTVVQTVAEQAAGDTDITDSTFTAAAAVQQDTTVTISNVDDAETDATVTITTSTAVYNYTASLADFATAMAAIVADIDAEGGALATFDATYTDGGGAADDTLQIVGTGVDDSFTVEVTTGDAAYSTTTATATEFAAATVHADDTFVTDQDVISGAADTINGGSGDDTIEGMVGADVIDGGTGSDTASYAQSNAAVTVNLATGVNAGGHAVGDTLTNINNVSGSAFDDTLIGDDTANVLTGGLGDDALTGNGGADTFVITAEGEDTIADFTAGSDTIDVDALLDGITKAYEEIADDGADITTDANVVVIGGVTTIAAAAAAIAADATVTGADGLIVFSDGTDTFVYSTDDLANDGNEALLVTLTGVTDATDLVEGSFTFA